MINTPQKWISLYDAWGWPALVVDSSGRILCVNETGRSLWERPEESLTGRSWIPCCLPASVHDDAERRWQAITAQPPQDGVLGEWRSLSREGRCLTLRWRVGPLDDTLWLIVAEDVTAQRRAEEDMLYQASIIESSDDAVLGLTLEGMITAWNKGCERLFGYSGGQMLGKPLDLLIPDERPNDVPVILEAVQSGRPLHHYETAWQSRAGEILDLSLTVSPIRNLNDRIIGASIIARDITQRKKIEQDLERYRHKLELLVEERTRQWQETNEALRLKIEEHRRTAEELAVSTHRLQELSAYLQNMREKERSLLAREIHDELGQLLTALRLDVAWLLRRVSEGGGDETAAKKLKTMDDIVEKTMRTVQRLCLQLRPSLLDDLGFCAAVQWLVEDFQRHAPVVCRLVMEPDQFALDDQRAIALFRILQEALTNVARHAHAQKVDITIRCTADQVTMDIHDDGRGIPPDKIMDARSFGLMGMRQRLYLFGGECRISGDPLKGTHIHVTCPLFSKINPSVSSL